jgi:hypothetical protein
VSNRYQVPIDFRPPNSDGIVGRSENMFESFKWRNAEIPVVIDPNIFSSGLIDAVYDGLEELNNKTVLCFRPKVDGDKDYIRIKYDRSIPGAGRSYVGRDGGEQVLLLNGGANKGTVTHEALHAAGFYHEQSRNDRDNYVRIIEDNIKDDADHNFDTADDPNTPYDYCSIMHYSNKAFSKNGKPTIECIDKGKTIQCPSCMGNTDELSALDIKGINDFYAEVKRFPCGKVWRPANPTTQPSNYNVASNGYNYLTGDFNGDGKTDIVHIMNKDYLHVWMSDGNGKFSIKSPFPQRNGYDLKNGANFKFLTGDFNGDGKTDLVHIVDWNYLHVWISKGDGTFDIKNRYPAQNGYSFNNDAGYNITVGDFNGDGKSDLFHVVNGNYAHVLLSKGDGNFDVKNRFPAQNGYDLVGGAKFKFLAGDFNGDGKTDMVHVVDWNYLHVWLSKGDGSFDIKNRFPAQNGYSFNNDAGYHITVGDFNGDGKSDLFHVINGDYSHTWLSKGDGSFDIKERFPAQNGYNMKNEANYKFLPGDFNGDGKTDLIHIVNNDYSHTWLSKGDGNYDIKPRFPAQNGYALKNDSNFKFIVGNFDGNQNADMIHMTNARYTHLWLGNGNGMFIIGGQFYP